MAKMMYRDAVRSTIFEEMERDDRVVVLGEDIVGGMGTAGGPEAIGGIWYTSTGFYDRFGPDRVIDTPISEANIMGAAVGMALAGLRPVVEMRVIDFALCAMDEIINQAAHDSLSIEANCSSRSRSNGARRAMFTWSAPAST